MSYEFELQSLTQTDFVLPTRSGTTAIIAALTAANIPSGSEVILPSICCPAVEFAVNTAGYTPIIADVDSQDFCMGPKEIIEAISEQTKAIIAVHSYGRSCKIKEIEKLAKEGGFFLIDDACPAMGGYVDGKSLGSFGDVGVLSFGYDKIIDEGGGGALVTNNLELFENCRKFLNQNSFFSYQDVTNRTDRIKQKILNLPENVRKRSYNASIYDQSLNPEKVFKPAYRQDIVYWRYPALYRGDRKRLVEEAMRKNIIITTRYKGLHQLRTMPELTNAEYISNHVISLFVRPETPLLHIQKTISFINGN